MLKKLHKIIGLSICLIVIHLSVTGIILMHPNTFRLFDTYFTNNYIYSLYNMHKASDVKVSSSKEDLGVVASKIIVSDTVLETGIKDIISLLKQDNYIFIINDKTFAIIEETDYELKLKKKIELDFEAISLGTNNNEVFLKDVNKKYYRLDEDLNFSLVVEDSTNFIESRLIRPDEETSSYFLTQVQGPGIQALRLFADLHNGRFFGNIVMIIFSLCSLGIIFLAITGTLMSLNISLKRIIYKKRKKVINRK